MYFIFFIIQFRKFSTNFFRKNTRIFVKSQLEIKSEDEHNIYGRIRLQSQKKIKNVIKMSILLDYANHRVWNSVFSKIQRYRHFNSIFNLFRKLFYKDIEQIGPNRKFILPYPNSTQNVLPEQWRIISLIPIQTSQNPF